MPRTHCVSSLWWLLAPLLLALACSHDAPRDNPLDPTLTPPVELQVALDDTAGMARLTWTPYAGDQPFAAYWVLRKVPGLEAVDTLAAFSEVGRTSWVDTSVSQHTVYEYRVSAVNAGGYAATSGAQTVGPMRLPPVEIVSAVFDSRSASVALRWTGYEGLGFRAYQVRRRTEKLASEVVAELADSTETSWADSGLKGATVYYYQVVVLTKRGDEVASPEVAGSIHGLVATWPLDVDIVGRSAIGNARLYSEPDYRMVALVAGTESVRIASYDRAHGLIEDRDLGFTPNAGQSSHGLGLVPNNIAMALDPQGRRLLSMQPLESGSSGPLGVVHLHADVSAVLLRDWMPFGNVSPWVLDETESTVLGQIRMGTRDKPVAFDNVQISGGGEILLSEGFEAFPDEPRGTEQVCKAETLYGWNFEPDGGSGCHHSRDGWVSVGWGSMSRADVAWQDFRLEADVIAREDSFYIEMGGDTYSRFRLTVNRPPREVVDGSTPEPQVQLTWIFEPPEELDTPARMEYVAQPFRAMSGMRYRLGLEVADGEVRAMVRGPMGWGRDPDSERAPMYGSLAMVGEALALTLDERAYSVDSDGAISALDPLDSWVSETRAWQAPGERLPRMGVCMPELNQIRTGSVYRASAWPQAVRTPLGPLINQEAGFLNYPVSFDVSPGGRMYVLDAGNARIVEFDADGKYISRWGGLGSGDGQFNFGLGLKRLIGLDFTGSLCVDDEGYIYVADVFNRRIQVFAP